jgi:hypothetical protein
MEYSYGAYILKNKKEKNLNHKEKQLEFDFWV